LGAVEEATAEAAKHGGRSSEALAALVAEAREMLEQAKAEQAERARVAAEAAAAAAAVKAEAEAEAGAERLRLEERAAALALRVQGDMLELQQMRAQLGSSVAPPATPAPDVEETLCVVCFDAPKDHLVLPCKHLCVCEACAEQLTKTRTPTCPVCCGPIRETMKVFCS
jgi:hypothetical protein